MSLEPAASSFPPVCSGRRTGRRHDDLVGVTIFFNILLNDEAAHPSGVYWDSDMGAWPQKCILNRQSVTRCHTVDAIRIFSA